MTPGRPVPAANADPALAALLDLLAEALVEERLAAGEHAQAVKP